MNMIQAVWSRIVPRMRSRLTRTLLPVLLIILVLSPPLIALAATMSANLVTDSLPLVGGFTTSPYGIGTSSVRQTFYADGRNWIFYIHNTAIGVSDLYYTSAQPGSEWETPTLIAENCSLYGVEFAVFYDAENDKVHYARHQMNEDPTSDTVLYRMGTPGSDGVITWAAVEQEVADVPAGLLTWRTTIAVDELGFPWVAYIDTNGVDAYGVLYVESSNTSNGVWTKNTSANITIDVADIHTWFVGLTPLNNDGDIMEVEFTIEDMSGGPNDGDVALLAYRYNTVDGWSGPEVIADWGAMSVIHPEGFSFFDLGAAVYGVYTNNLGSVMYRVRSQIQSWNAADAATPLKEVPGSVLIPTISGYSTNGPGMRLVCLIHDTHNIYSATLPYSGSWTTFSTIYTTTDNISRHVANYSYNPTSTDTDGDPYVGFAWQETDVSDTPDTDDVYFWWVNTETGTFGYYPGSGGGSGVGNTILSNILPLAIAIALVIAGFATVGKGPIGSILTIGTGIIVYYAIKALLTGLIS